MIVCPWCARVMERRDFPVHRKAAGHPRKPKSELVEVTA